MFALAACDNSSEQALRFATEAQSHMAAGNIAAAEKSIASAIAARDDVPDFYILSGDIKLAKGNRVGAYRDFKSAIDLDAGNIQALQQYCSLAVQLGEYGDADRAADTLMTLSPSSVVALQVKAMVAVFRERYDRAAEYTERLMSLSPNDPVAYTLKARILIHEEKYPEAREQLETGLASNADNPLLLANRLNLARKIGDSEAMAATFPPLMRLLPDNIDYRLDYANFQYRTGHAEEARSLIAKTLSDPAIEPTQLAMVLQLWSEHDNDPVSPAMIEEIVKADPEIIRAVCDYLLVANRATTAAQISQALTQRQANLMRGMLARIAAASGEMVRARSMSDDVLERDAHNIDALIVRAGLNMKARNWAKAIIDLQTVMNENPESYSGYDMLARAYVGKGEMWRAQQIYAQGVKALPQNHFLQAQYLSFLHQIGDNGRAMATADLFSKANPASLKGWDRYAQICARYTDAACAAKARAGHENAQTIYALDYPLGYGSRMGLFGRI